LGSTLRYEEDGSVYYLVIWDRGTAQQHGKKDVEMIFTLEPRFAHYQLKLPADAPARERQTLSVSVDFDWRAEVFQAAEPVVFEQFGLRLSAARVVYSQVATYVYLDESVADARRYQEMLEQHTTPEQRQGDFRVSPRITLLDEQGAAFSTSGETLSFGPTPDNGARITLVLPVLEPGTPLQARMELFEQGSPEVAYLTETHPLPLALAQ
jgi:hypothetical protein